VRAAGISALLLWFAHIQGCWPSPPSRVARGTVVDQTTFDSRTSLTLSTGGSDELIRICVEGEQSDWVGQRVVVRTVGHWQCNPGSVEAAR
jgi:hypothetical protein